MKKRIILVCFAMLYFAVQAYSQEPQLVEKKTLPTELSGAHSFTGVDGSKDILEIPMSMFPSSFSLEVKGKVNSATGRGLDVDLRKKDFSGFRTSWNKEKFQWTAPLSSSYMMNFSSASEQTIRYAVDGNNVHIYQNGTYIDTKSLTSIYDIEDDGVENTNPDLTSQTTGDNLAVDFMGNLTTQTPYEAGWRNNGTGNVPWQSPNAYGVRFTNNYGGATYNGAPYSGEWLLMLRWESGVTNGSSYYHPVELAANTTYNFSFIRAYWNNGSSGTFSAAVSRETTGDNLIAEYTTTESTWTKQQMSYGDVSFTTSEAGTYYIMFKNDGEGIWVVGEMILKEFATEPRIILGKNYPDGLEDMEISSVTYDETGAYAPEKLDDNPKFSVNITDEASYTISRFINANVLVSGKSNVHITSLEPLWNSSVDLLSNDSWLFLDRVQPSEFLNEDNGYLSAVKINGSGFNSEKDRVAIYGSGCVIIPNGKAHMEEAITIYSGENFTGESKSFAINVYNNNLGDFDNKVKSFKLKRGFSATLANNSDGTGFSKYYIASDEDLEVASMPDGLVFVSFIRAFKWEWTSKKGTANLSLANPSIIYNWSAGGDVNNPDAEFVPIRQNGGWPSFSEINELQNVSHLLGFNEPARPDQANISVNAAVAQWPEMFKSGLRIGSPAPASIASNWLSQFIGICDTLNYRVDFIAFHAYQDQNTGWWDWNVDLAARASGASSVKRPVWITEWNNGANWTNEADASKWPTYTGTQVDVDGNEIGGNVTLPLSPENAARQKAKLEEMLNYFENNTWVEHQFLYNWVNDARKLELDGKLTPAGEMFAAFNSGVGFNKANEYDHQWKIAPAWLEHSISDDYSEVTISWYDHNGETGKQYVLERKIESDNSYVQIANFTLGEDYEAGGVVSIKERLAYNSASYRIKAVSYKDTESGYSRELVVAKDASAGTPMLTGEILSSTKIQLEWDEVINARSYNIKRSTEKYGTYEVIAEKYQGTSYLDEGLKKEVTYYYKISAVNTSGEGVDSPIVEFTTPGLTVPEAVPGLYVSSSDAAAVLTWDFQYDTKYIISRSNTEDGEYKVLINDFEGTRYVDSNAVENGETYYYKVQAINELGTGPLSDVYVATPKVGQHVLVQFDEAEGATSYDEWGGYHATLIDGASWVEESTGEGIGAVEITSANKSYVELGAGLTDEIEEFTIATWFKNGHANGSNARLFDFGNGTGAYMCMIPYSTDKKVFFVLNPAEGSNYENKIDYQIPYDEWIHFAITFTSTSYKLYINGELVGQDNNNTAGITPKDMGHTTQNWLGKSQWVDAWADYAYDDFRMYNFAMDANAIAKLANREEVNLNYAVKLRGLTINGEEWDASKTYVLGCDGNETSVTLGITTDEGVSVQDLEGNVLSNNQLLVGGLFEPGDFSAEFRLVSDADPTVVADYSIGIVKYIAFADIVEERWGNVLAVNNNSANNGGYDFVDYTWYKNGVVVSNKQYYTAGQKGAKLDANATFYVEVTTSDGRVLRTCESTVELKESAINVYPTQVDRGQLFNVEMQYLEEVSGAIISVYNLNGIPVASKKVEGSITTIAAPSMSGAYIVKVSSGSYSEQVKILVK